MVEIGDHQEGFEEVPATAEEHLNFGEVFPHKIKQLNPADVISQIAHDGRSPLSTVRNIAQILRIVLPGEHKEDLVPKLERSIATMEGTLRNAIKDTIQTRRVISVYKLLLESLQNGWMDDLREETKRSDWEVVLHPLESDLEDIHIASSESGWKTAILQNFVKNAVRAEAQKIDIRFVRHNDYGKDAVAVEITDDGHGMNQEIIDALMAGRWCSSGKTMQPGDTEDHHSHGFPSAMRTILQWGARLQVLSKEAKNNQRGKTTMRIIFNGAVSNQEDFPTVPVIEEEPATLPISPEVLAEFINGPSSDVSRVRTNRRRMIGATLAAGASIVMGGAYAVTAGRRRTTSAQALLSSASTPDVITEPNIPLLQSPSRVHYDERGQIIVIEGNGWIYEREGNTSPHVKVSEIHTSAGQILAFESKDYTKHPMPKLAMCNVEDRTFGYINTGRNAGYFSASHEAGRTGEVLPTAAVELTDTVYGPQGLRATKVEMLTSEVLGKQDDALQKFVHAVLRSKVERGIENAYQIATFLDRAMRMRDARTIRDISIDTLEELFSYLNEPNPLFAILQPSVKEQLRAKPFLHKNMPKAAGIHLCFPATNTQEAETYIDMKS